jgi:hypothetical protein
VVEAYKNIKDRKFTHERNIYARSFNHCCRGKAITTHITYSECVSIAVIQQAMLIDDNITGRIRFACWIT